MHVERERRRQRCRPARMILRDRRARNRPSKPARSDSSYSAVPAGCTSPETRRTSARSRVSRRFVSLMFAHVQLSRRHHARSCPASTNALAFSTGVVGKIPCPRFRMWPTPPVFSTASCAARRTPPRAQAESRGPHFLAARRVRPSFRRASARSVFQSTLRTSAPDFARLSRCRADPSRTESSAPLLGRARLKNHLRGRQSRTSSYSRSRKLARPGIEQLHGRSSRRDLHLQIFCRCAGDPLEQFAHQSAARSRSICFAREISPRVRPSIM